VSRRPRVPRSDRDLGRDVRTSRHVSIGKLALAGESKEEARRYEPTPFGVLEDMMLGLDIDPARFTFADLGAGKGRILCLASAWPFRRIVGVELSEDLAAAARHNVSNLSVEWQKCRRLEVVNGDAATWELPEEPLILYLFNPFGAAVIARLLDRIQASFDAAPRDIYVLYYMPVHAALFTRASCLGPYSASKDWTIWIASFEGSR
jgi:hypothetical protein